MFPRAASNAIGRRSVVVGGLAVLAAAVDSRAQQTAKVYRIGFLSGTTVPDLVEALVQGLRERGWLEGQHFTLEQRSAESKMEHVEELAGDLRRRHVDVIVVSATAMDHLKQATGTIPIVMAASARDRR